MGSTDGGITLDQNSELGYARSPALQAKFDQAAAALLESDGWKNPDNGDAKQLVADLALEGGGVKGIGLVGAVLVLHEAGYSFRCVAGTSAGAIAASLIAALSRPGQDMTRLKHSLDGLEFANFMPDTRLHKFMMKSKFGTILSDGAILTRRVGLYPGTYLFDWLGPILEDLGVRTFADLRLTTADDPGKSMPDGHDYRLVVHTSDLTRKVLVRLPWDYEMYGSQSDTQRVVDAVRASMSIPFFFEPVTFTAAKAEVRIPKADGTTQSQHFEGGEVTWVDGGLLRNFPIGAFDRVDDTAARWPTIGIKLSAFHSDFPQDKPMSNSLAVGLNSLHTMMNEWDMYSVDEATAARTIFVGSEGLSATDFHLTTEQQNTLFLNGVRSATQFILEMGSAGHVPRTASEGRDFAKAQRAGVPVPEAVAAG